MRFDSQEMHKRIKAKLMKNLPAEVVSEIPADNDKLDELVFRRLQAISENGLLSEDPMLAASAIAENLLGGDGPVGEPVWEVKKTSLSDRIVRSINRLIYQHQVLKLEGGKWKLSDRMDKPISSFPPVDPKVPGYRKKGA